MKDYMITYKVPKEMELELLYDAKDKSYEIFLSKLDCSKSFARVNTMKTFDEIIEIYKSSNFKHLVFQVRNMSTHFPKYEDYISVGAKTAGEKGIDYFIFISIDKKYFNWFVSKYKLTKI